MSVVEHFAATAHRLLADLKPKEMIMPDPDLTTLKPGTPVTITIVGTVIYHSPAPDNRHMIAEYDGGVTVMVNTDSDAVTVVTS